MSLPPLVLAFIFNLGAVAVAGLCGLIGQAFTGGDYPLALAFGAYLIAAGGIYFHLRNRSDAKALRWFMVWVALTFVVPALATVSIRVEFPAADGAQASASAPE
ncbi:MAG: hypothetical protein QM667_02510 [Asticcacaulis sp.]